MTRPAGPRGPAAQILSGSGPAATIRPAPVRLATAAMGTRFELVLGGGDARRLRSVGEAAVDVIESAHRRLSRFARDSLVSHINRTAARTPVRVDPDTFALFRDAAVVHAASGGAFDITVASVMAAWGLPSAAASGDPGDAARRSDPDVHHPPGMDALVLDEAARTVAFTRPGVSLDLGGIAKGHALDLAASLVREHGVSWALLHGGTSSVVAVGAPPAEAGWRVALAGFPEPAPVVTLRDATLSISSRRGRLLANSPGNAHGHLVDPTASQPAPGGRVAAVVCPSARLGDAWATALAVLGTRPTAVPEDWLSFIH